MSDPLRTDAPDPVESVSSDADLEAKIERLLLAGLEHYFAVQYDQAINVWTRALFLDRGHARARAYIERARSAQAEVLRASEELLQRGVNAFKQGEGDEARRLLRDAIEQGAPPEEALVILERLNRLAHVAPPVETAPIGRTRLPAPAEAAPRASRAAWAAMGVFGLVIVAAGAFAAGAFRSDWRPLLQRPPAAGAAPSRPAADTALPLPRRGETALTRARALAQGGRLHDALAALDAVRPPDAERPEADRLRAELQKQLIGLSVVAGPAPTAERRITPEP